MDAEELQQIDKAKAKRHDSEARDESKLIGWMCALLLFLKKDLTDPPELILLSSAGWLGGWLRVAGCRTSYREAAFD